MLTDPFQDEHRQVTQLFPRLREKASHLNRPADRAVFLELLGLIRHHLDRHLRAEETALWPFLVPHLSAGEEERLAEEHRRIREALDSLSAPDAPDRREVEREVAVFIRLLEEHIRNEEERVFPLAEARLTPEDVGEIARRLKHFA